MSKSLAVLALLLLACGPFRPPSPLTNPDAGKECYESWLTKRSQGEARRYLIKEYYSICMWTIYDADTYAFYLCYPIPGCVRGEDAGTLRLKECE